MQLDEEDVVLLVVEPDEIVVGNTCAIGCLQCSERVSKEDLKLPLSYLELSGEQPISSYFCSDADRVFD